MNSSLTDPTQHLAWLGSRSLGIVAMLLLAASVGFGFALSGRLGGRPGSAARLKTLHEAFAVGGLVAIVGHGLLLLADPYLSPGLAGIALPFAMPSQPVWTGLGIIGGWLTAIVTLSFYARRWIGAGVWRSLHRWTLAVFALAIAHTLGSGTDSGSTWLLVLLSIAIVPAVSLGLVRLLPIGPNKPKPALSERPPRVAPPAARASHRSVRVPPARA